jgi:glycerol uptake facilitator-like aquaporin
MSAYVSASKLTPLLELFFLHTCLQFFCSLLFAFFGGAAPSGSGAAANGVGLAVLVYVAANVSGGHLNPAGKLQDAVSCCAVLPAALPAALTPTPCAPQ